jgi:hypothetical protein
VPTPVRFWFVFTVGWRMVVSPDRRDIQSAVNQSFGGKPTMAPDWPRKFS